MVVQDAKPVVASCEGNLEKSVNEWGGSNLYFINLMLKRD